MADLLPNPRPQRRRSPQCSNRIRTNKSGEKKENKDATTADESESKRVEELESKRAVVSETTNQAEEGSTMSLRSVATIANLATGRSSSDAVMEHNSDSISNATTKDAKVTAEESESKRKAVELELNRVEESVMTLVSAATIANLATGRSSSDAVMEPNSDCVSISKLVSFPNHTATIASLATGCSSNNAVTGANTIDHCDIIMDEVLDDSDHSIASQLSSSNESIVRQLKEKKMK